jgi:hypothetical protein
MMIMEKIEMGMGEREIEEDGRKQVKKLEEIPRRWEGAREEH